MSYRTYVNGIQVFGNNECYAEWLTFIESQGITVNDEGDYEGDITDVMGAVKTIENIILRLAKGCNEPVVSAQIAEKVLNNTSMSLEKKNLLLKDVTKPHNLMFDLSNTYERILLDQKDKYGFSVTDIMVEMIDYSYMFMSVAFLKACKDLIERAERPDEDINHRLIYWKVKDGKKIHVRAG